MRSITRVAVTIAIALALATSSCGGGDQVTYDSRDDRRGGSIARATTIAPTTSSTVPDPPGRSYIAETKAGDQPVAMFDAAGGSPKTVDLVRLDPPGFYGTFLVRQRGVQANGETWAEVDLPVRPAGSTAWLREADVTINFTDYLVVVERGAHQLRLEQNGTTIRAYPIAVGTTNTPTPGGTFYVKELLKPTNADGAFGPYAYGLSGYSSVITESDQFGDGVIGIHGTNQPETIGTDVSHGCIRMRNEDITELQTLLPLGTPVRIDA